jgi:formate hydrogenlyase transcriptional activator
MEKPDTHSQQKGLANKNISIDDFISPNQLSRHKQIETDNATLLSISHGIAAIRDKDDLLNVLNYKIKKLFPFNDIIVTLYNPESNTYRTFLHICEAKRSSHPDFIKVHESCGMAQNDIVNSILTSAEPQLFSIDSLSTKSHVADYIKFYNDTGIKEIIAVGMRSGDNVFGGLYLLTEKMGTYNTHNFKLIKGLANQLSVAISNILANQQIIRKEKETAVLLSLSNAIAVTRSKSDLFNVIDRNLKSIFPFDDFVICLINDDKQTHSAYLYNDSEVFQNTPGVVPRSSRQFTMDDGLCELIMAEESPIVLNIEEVLTWEKHPGWVEFWHNIGIKEMIAFAIYDRKVCIGFFYLFAKQQNAISNEYYNILKSIGLQISVAVSNIKANEKIEQQLAEINAYKQQLEDEKLYLREQIETNYNHIEIIGSSAVMQKALHLVEQVAFSDSTVLILGETGTGKELIARAIHNNSPRKQNLMIKLNCATLPANLIESELFGHEKGSFTGATERRLGKFELANNSSLFLDEIGELPLELQVKLLRALQEKEIERIGGKGVIKTNVRIIAATNRNLLKEVQAGNFRSDLYYRLNVFPITLPQLKERKEDIEILTQHFIARYNKNAGKRIKGVSQSVLKSLLAYNWPGNIRELEHLIERSVLLSTGTVISEVHLPKNDPKELAATATNTVQIKSIYENERDYILSMLKLCNGKIAGTGGAAELMAIPATTLNSKIKKFKIKREHTLK